MATVALAFHSIDNTGKVVPGGHAYVVLSEPYITVREILDQKVRAEFRKSRALDIEASSLRAIFGRSFDVHAPLDQQFACLHILTLFTHGYIALLVDGVPAVDLDYIVELKRRTGLALVVPVPESSVTTANRSTTCHEK